MAWPIRSHSGASHSLSLGERVAEGRVRMSTHSIPAHAKVRVMKRFQRQAPKECSTWIGSLTLTLSQGERGPGKGHSRSGFTLVEMLMAVTLVLIMMVMFAEVFQLAGGSVTKQRTLADNDQNARTLMTILKRDLDQRTFRSLVPFYANEPITVTRSDAGTDNGYFYISNNYLGDFTDDVLQFTMDSTINTKKVGESKFYGAAAQLPYPPPAVWTTNPAARVYHFLRNANQPDGDDGEILSNGAGTSTAAEVSYFMRGSRLYRRVMLIRDPLKQANVDSTNPGQPIISEDFNLSGGLNAATEDVNNNMTLDSRLDYFAYPFPAYSLGYNPLLATPPTSFWGQFDYSAFQASPTLAGVLPGGARFVGTKPFLENKPILAFPLLSPYCYSLGQTWNRFGFNSAFTAGNAFNGLPREFSGLTAPNFFLGRFTQEETSNPAFMYPQVMPATGNPMDATATTYADANSDGVIDSLAGGPRASVDLLLSNVHEFRVEVWDERLQDFAPIGHRIGEDRNGDGILDPGEDLNGNGSLDLTPPIAGDYNTQRQLNPTFGPLVAAGTVAPNVFDTWHPLFNRNVNPVLGDAPDRPPFRPVTVDPTGVSGPTYTNPSGAPIWWTPGTVYQPGDVVFPRREDLNGNGFLDPGEDGSNGFPADGALQENQRVFVEDTNGNGILDPGEDLNGNLVLDPPSAVGQIFEDINQNGVLNPGEDGLFNLPADGFLNGQRFQLRQPCYPSGLTYRYVCVRNGTTSARTIAFGGTPSILDEPGRGAWSTTPDFIITGWSEDTNKNNVVDPGEDINGNGSVNGVTDREPEWLVVYNARPLRAIRITVRYEHPTTQQMKQVTIVHSLRDTLSVP